MKDSTQNIQKQHMKYVVFLSDKRSIYFKTNLPFNLVYLDECKSLYILSTFIEA